MTPTELLDGLDAHQLDTIEHDLAAFAASAAGQLHRARMQERIATMTAQNATVQIADAIQAAAHQRKAGAIEEIGAFVGPDFGCAEAIAARRQRIAREANQ